jgi:tetratricopeptide (TPR) repeat protein
MIVRLSNAFSRKLVLVIALLVGGWLSFFGIRTAIARYDYESGTQIGLESAVHLEPDNFAYWFLLGRSQQGNLEQPDSALAEEYFRKAIALNPLATDAWLDLAVAYEMDGKNAEAREAYLRAKKSYPASASVSWVYGNYLLRQGELTQAYAELHHAIEADPHFAAQVFTLSFRTTPNIDEILAEVLPAKQSVYVDVVTELVNKKRLADAKIVWARLITLHPRLTIREVNPLVQELGIAGELPEARRIWDEGMATMNLPPLYTRRDSVVWDPSFESNINGYSFAWYFQPFAQGVTIALDKSEKRSGNQSLRLSFDGKHNPNLEAACTIGAVRSGTTYSFSGWVKTKDITTKYGIGFKLRSVEGGDPMVTTREVHGTNPWTLVDATWTAGPSTRTVQICVSREPSDNPEVRISGNAWVDDVNLIPKSAEDHKP